MTPADRVRAALQRRDPIQTVIPGVIPAAPRRTDIAQERSKTLAPTPEAPPVVVVAYGLPAPQGSKRFVGKSKSGRGIMVESSAKVRPWRQDVKAAALAVRAGAEPLDCPLTVRMVFTMPKPKSAPKKRKTWPSNRPDVSKLARSTEDALTDAGLISDDARIVELTALKVFPREHPSALDCPGVRIEIRRLST